MEGLDEASPSATARQIDDSAAGDNASVPYVSPIECGEHLSQFKQMLLGRLDNISGNQMMHHEYYAAHFQVLRREIEQIQDQLDSMGFINEE